MQLTSEESNGAVTEMVAHLQSAADDIKDDAEQAVVTGSTRAGDFAVSPVGVVGPQPVPTTHDYV